MTEHKSEPWSDIHADMFPHDVLARVLEALGIDVSSATEEWLVAVMILDRYGVESFKRGCATALQPRERGG